MPRQLPTTIPTRPRPRGGYIGPHEGQFVDYGDGEVKLFSLTTGDRWSAESVTICQGSFGFSDEGVSRMPRPWLYDDSQQVVVEGDRVIIDFIGGNMARPFVRGGVLSLTSTDLSVRHNDGVTWNRLRLQLKPKDAAGAASGGTILIDLCGDDLASISARVDSWVALATSLLAVTVGSWEGRVEDGVLTITGTGDGAQAVLRGEKFLDQLTKVLSELSASNAALGLPITETLVMISQIALATGPDGYLAKHLSTE